MSIDKKILKEIQKYNTINKYISEQFDAEAPETDAAAPTDTALPADGAATTDAGVDAIPEPVDIANDPDVEVVDDTEGDVATDVTSTEPTEEGGTEELDITDLVTSQKDIQSKQDEFIKAQEFFKKEI